MPTPLHRAGLLIVAIGLASGCADPAPTLPPAATAIAVRLSVEGGDLQRGIEGTSLDEPLRVRVVDRTTGRPIAGQVVNFRVAAGGGAMFAGTALTDADGRAADWWTLGPASADTQRVEVRTVDPVSGTRVVHATFRALAGSSRVPAAITVTAGADQVATAGQPLGVRPAVRVTTAAGAPVADVAVTYAVIAGGGRIDAVEARTDSAGVATAGAWTLGRDAGVNRLRAEVAGVGFVTFTATGTATNSYTMVPVAGASVACPVRTYECRFSVRVLDPRGAPAAGEAVVWSIPDAGSQTNTTYSDASGLAGSANVYAYADPVTVTQEARLVRTGQTLRFAFTHTVQSSVARIAFWTDGPPTSALRVTVDGVEVGQLTGHIAGAPPACGAPGTLTVNAQPGSRVVGATATGLEWPPKSVSVAPGECVPFRFIAPSSTGGTYSIDARFSAGVPANVRTAVSSAIARVRSIVTSSVGTQRLQGQDMSGCGAWVPTPFSGSVTDHLMFVSVVPIDGRAGVLAQAGPCLGWQGSLVLVSSIEVDAADVGLPQNELNDVLLHETLHAMGFGSLRRWDALLVRAGSDDPVFTGASSLAAWLAIGGSRFNATAVPVENQGGPGSADSHWRERILGAELMTSQLNAGRQNPVSALTIAALADLGYVVRAGSADPYGLTSAFQLQESEGPEQWDVVRRPRVLTPLGSAAREATPVSRPRD